jgi:hypothetical protein
MTNSEDLARELYEALKDLGDAYCDAGPGSTREKRTFGRKAFTNAQIAIVLYEQATTVNLEK